MHHLAPNVDLFQRLISASDLRQQVISQNIANVNTPNYRAVELSFEDQLAVERAQSRPGAATDPQVEPTIRESNSLVVRGDGNSVDIEREMGALNKNALLQQTWLQLMGVELGMMRRAIEGR